MRAFFLLLAFVPLSSFALSSAITAAVSAIGSTLLTLYVALIGAGAALWIAYLIYRKFGGELGAYDLGRMAGSAIYDEGYRDYKSRRDRNDSYRRRYYRDTHGD